MPLHLGNASDIVQLVNENARRGDLRGKIMNYTANENLIGAYIKKARLQSMPPLAKRDWPVAFGFRGP
jgi:hypothetical protein